MAKSICNTGDTCNVTIKVSQYMTAPIYFMYEIGNFYQNHRRYIQSKSNYQLAGNAISSSSQSQVCWPFVTNEDMGVTKSWGNTTLNSSAIASPCGAIGKRSLTQPRPSSTILSQCTRTQLKSQSIKPGSRGLETKDISTNVNQIARRSNGSTPRMSISLYG